MANMGIHKIKIFHNPLSEIAGTVVYVAYTRHAPIDGKPRRVVGSISANLFEGEGAADKLAEDLATKWGIQTTEELEALL